MQIINNYKITYNPLFNEWAALSTIEGSGEYFKTREEAINYASNG